MQKFKNYFPKVDNTCYIAPGTVIIGNVVIGKGTSVWHNTVVRGDIEKITIGKYCNIQECSILHTKRGTELIVGEYVTVGHGAILHSCNIGDNCLIGMGAIVLDNVKVGDHCLIGAGALVTPGSVIPDKSLVLGNPGKIKRQLTDEEINNIRENAERYVALANDYKDTENSFNGKG